MIVRRVKFWVLAATLALIGASAAQAQYFRPSESDIDPKTFEVDQQKIMGVKVPAGMTLTDLDGKPMKLGDMLGQPLILVLSYYTCDGSCSVINQDLLDLLMLLRDSERVKSGQDYKVLTLSFDRNDTVDTLGAFRTKLRMPNDLAKDWTFGLAADFEELKSLAHSLDYRFFWSPPDRTFFHPGAFFFLTPEGRVSRVLYALANEAKDVELAVLDAKQSQMKAKDIINFAVSLCYSYNYKEGRYTYNIPLFVAVGSLTLGVSALTGSLFVFKRRRKKIMKGSS